MIKKIFLSVVLFPLIFGLFAVLMMAHVSAAADTTTPPVTPTNSINSPQYMYDMTAIEPTVLKKQNWIQKGINYFFERIIGIMASLVGSVAVLMMTWGGFQMIISGGGDQYERGKSTMKRAALGIVVVLGAYILVTSVQLLIKSIYGS
jgi:Type IV secretion system pilin